MRPMYQGFWRMVGTFMRISLAAISAAASQLASAPSSPGTCAAPGGQIITAPSSCRCLHDAHDARRRRASLARRREIALGAPPEPLTLSDGRGSRPQRAAAAHHQHVPRSCLNRRSPRRATSSRSSRGRPRRAPVSRRAPACSPARALTPWTRSSRSRRRLRLLGAGAPRGAQPAAAGARRPHALRVRAGAAEEVRRDEEGGAGRGGGWLR